MSIRLHDRAEALALVAGGVLADFERETIAEISDRRFRLGDLAVITPIELIVLTDAVAAMDANLRQEFDAGKFIVAPAVPIDRPAAC